MRKALRVAGLVFLVVALLHILRLIFKVQITAVACTLPQWTSAVAALAALLLALWMFRASSGDSCCK